MSFTEEQKFSHEEDAPNLGTSESTDGRKVGKWIDQSKNHEDPDRDDEDRVLDTPQADYSQIQKKVIFVQNAEEKDPERPLSQKWPEAIAQARTEVEKEGWPC